MLYCDVQEIVEVIESISKLILSFSEYFCSEMRTSPSCGSFRNLNLNHGGIFKGARENNEVVFIRIRIVLLHLTHTDILTHILLLSQHIVNTKISTIEHIHSCSKQPHSASKHKILFSLNSALRDDLLSVNFVINHHK